MAIRLLLDAYELTQYAVSVDPNVQPVMLCDTLDGARLTKYIGHVTSGIKMVDPRAIDPVTQLSLYISSKIQSRDLCFAMMMACAKDNKYLYADVFKEWFEFCQRMEKGIAFPAHDGLPALPNICRVSAQDMSSFWKVLQRGGECHQSVLLPLLHVYKRRACSLESGG